MDKEEAQQVLKNNHICLIHFCPMKRDNTVSPYVNYKPEGFWYCCACREFFEEKNKKQVSKAIEVLKGGNG